MSPAALPRLPVTEPSEHQAVDRSPSSSATTACAFELVRERDAFDALETEWNELFSRAGLGTQVFQTFNWNWHWCNHYLAESKAGTTSLAVVTARRGGRLVLVWPLVKERAAGLTQLTWMGEPVSQYGDVLIENGPDAVALLREAWRFIESEISPDVVRLRKVRDDAAIAPLLAELEGLPTQRLEAP
jgi:CelD/BcsL family acetyltransferase involved in cellulose biosynthesis